MGGFLALILVLWFIFGEPAKDTANWFWENEPAPWETVDAYFYPNRNNLDIVESNTGLSSIDECRDWVNRQASIRNDPNMTRSDYECGIEHIDDWGGLKVYRTTTK